MSRTITFYKLISPYTEDITKNCSLFGNEIDDNFMNLKELSIDSVELSGTTIIIKRIGNEQLTVDLSEIIPDEPTMSVSYDEELGKIQIEFNEETFIIDGLLNQVNSTKLFLKKVAADLTLTGNGTIQNPLTINLTHKTGMYEPAIEYLDLTSGDTLPTSGMSIGDSYITKEIRNSFGYLYNLEGINEIKQSLLAENSEWRVPTKEDWDVMLNALECDGFKNHNNTEVSIILGKDAGKILKSREYWQESNETNAGNDTYLFSSIPSGYGDDTKLITHAYEWGEYWTDTESSDFEHYTKQFRFDETGVYQLSRNINDYFSLRLVKTYNGENLVEYEKINNAIVKTDLMPSDSGETRLVWTMEDLNFGEDNYGGLRTPLLDEITETDLFYNVWNGNTWLKRKMKEGETTVILSDSGDTIYNICMVVNHELINTNVNEIAISGQVLTNAEDIGYLQSSKANVSDLLSVSGQVSANTEDISNLYTNKADKATTLSGYGITDAYTKTESDDKYETIANIDLLEDIVSGNTDDIYDLQSNKADKATTLSGYGITDAYTKTESDDKYETIENVDLLEGIVSGNTEDIENLQSDKADKATTLSGYGITDAYTKTELDGKYETIENVDLLEGIVSGNTEAIENLQSDKADKATTLSGYGITDAYNKTEIDNKISTVFRYKGSVATYNTLTTLTGMLVGDVYNVNETGDNYAWTGTLWDKLAGEVDLSAYLTSANASNTYETITNVNLLRNIVTGNTEGIGYLQSSKANASDVLSISAQVLANNEDIFNLQSDKADKATTLSGYGIANAYTKTESDGKYETIENVDLLEGIVSGNTEAIENLQSDKANTATTLSGYGITDAYTKTESDNKYETIANIDLLEDIVSGNTEDISVLQSNKADASDLSSLSGQVSVNTEAIENLQSNKANTATTLSGYGITDAYTKTEINNKISAVFRYKGSVSTYFDLIALTGMTVGDVYNVTETGDNYAWTETLWDKLAGEIDLSAYLTSADASNTYETIANVNVLRNIVTGNSEDISNKADKATTYTKTEVDTKLDNIEHDNTLNKNSNPDFLHITETEKTNFVTASDFVEDFISNATAILYADLLALIDNNELIPSSNYRITNYTTTTVQADTQSAGHDFDIIVTALSTNELYENAKCVRKADDTYFVNANLETWEIKYCINNDTTRFAFADNVNGKGVIYYMKDENGNELPYDFKNIQYLKDGVLVYTFGGTTDNSLSVVCSNNKINPYISSNKQTLNNITFGDNCYSNTFGGNCYSNTFGWNCYSNTFDNGCYSNTFSDEFFLNTFGNYCYSNNFDDFCFANTFGNNCSLNTFGSDCGSNTFYDGSYSNTFGAECYYNTFGYNCHSNTFSDECNSNIFGDNCSTNNFGDVCQSNVFGNNCYSNNFYHGLSGITPKNYIQYIVLEDGVRNNNFYSDVTTAPSAYLQRIRIKGLGNTTTTDTTITLPTTNTDYEWVVAKNSDDVVKQYCPENLVDAVISIISLTWSELKNLRDNGQLVSGQSYRIIDYTTTTSQANTSAAGNDFDIVVVALDENTFSESASAVRHDGDTYFANAKVESWELKYCIDNDNNRFAWALNRIIVDDDSYDRSKLNDKTISEIVYYAWIDTGDLGAFYYTLSEHPKIGDAIYYSNGDLTGNIIGNIISGKGVIYYMKDENGNECPYDFKNIQFVRKLTNGYLDEDNGVYIYVYTFTWFDENNVVKDLSIIGNELTNDTQYKPGIFNNTIKETTAYSVGFEINTPLFVLGDNVFLNHHSYDGGLFYGCFNNSFGVNCYSNTFDDVCYSNTFGDNCYSNTFGSDCSSNTFGYGCSSNTFGYNCFSNTFGNNFDSNTFGNYCYYNTFGNYCNSNVFGNDCYSNTFGDECRSNKFYHGSNGTMKKNYIRYIVLEDGVSNNNFYSDITTAPSAYLQRIRIKGLGNTTTTNTQINTTTNNKFEWVVAKNSTGTSKQYCPEDLVL